MATPWLTSQDLVAAVQRKISMPLSQQTFSSNDILDFVNDEMMLSQVPSVLAYHEEYYVTIEYQALFNGVSKYPIPNRAIGGKLRNLSWNDVNNNLFEMTRVNSDDKSFFQANVGANSAIHKFYLEGNNVVLTPAIITEVQGQLVFAFFIRPNQLVDNSRAAIATGFQQTITVNNANLAAGDFIIIGGIFVPEFAYPPLPPPLPPFGSPWPNNSSPYAWQPPGVVGGLEYHAVSTAPIQPTDFQIGANSIATATNLVTTLVANGYTASNVGGTSNVVTLNFSNVQLPIVPGSKPNGLITSISVANPTVITAANHGLSTGNTVVITLSNSVPLINGTYTVTVLNTNQFTIPVNVTTAGTFAEWQQSSPLAVPSTLGVVCSSIPTNITNGSVVDFLQTLPGHRILNYDVTVPASGISGNVITFNYSDVPSNMVVGDYICSENECIIPYLPTDLHSGLAERACARILAAIGDQAGLQASQAKIQEINGAQGALLDNRTEGNPIKVLARHSLLRYGKIGIRRRV